MEVTSTPTCLNFPGGRTLASSRHRPSADVLVSSAADFCHRLDRELRSLGLRRDERQFFVLTLASDPMDVWFGASDLRAGDKDAENSAEAVLRTAVRVETARARKLEEQLEACQVAKAQAEQAAADQEIRARSAEAVQQQLQNRLRRHKMAWEGRAKHAADTVQTMKRMAELDEEANGQQRDELLAELDAARQRVSHAERAVVVCDHNKARMAENFAMMERELRDVRRRAQHDRAQHETTTKRLQAAKEQAESEAEQCRAAAEQAQTELDRTKIRLRQLKDLSNLNRKSGTKMRDDVHTTKLKCLDMESKAAKNQERLKKKEVQLATALRKSANESKARLALQRQIQQLTQQVSTLRSREKSLEDQLAASLAHIEAQDLRLATETRGRLFFRGLLIDCETKLAAVLAAREGAAGQWEAAAGYFLCAMRARGAHSRYAEGLTNVCTCIGW